MVFFIILLFSQLAMSRECEGPQAPLEDVANTLCLFQRPLVIGASVSAGYGTSTGGPSAILSRRLNPDTAITNRAISGATSMASTSFFPAQLPSIVLGFDMFFWDAARGNCGEAFLRETRAFFRRYQSRGVPMVIGRIPVGARFPMGVRLAGASPCAPRINALIAQECTFERNCLIYDPKECIDDMGSPVSPEGDAYFLDALHPSTAGNKFCAEHFVARAGYQQLRCRIR